MIPLPVASAKDPRALASDWLYPEGDALTEDGNFSIN